MAAKLVAVEEFKVDMAQELGRGAFGTVYVAFDKSCKIKYAVKKLKKPSSKILTNIENLKQLGQGSQEEARHILFAHAMIETEGHTWVFMPLCEFGDLNDYFLNHFTDISDIMKLNFMQQIILGLSYLHGRKIIHRDIKPANILVAHSVDENQPLLKLSDFDLSKFIGSEEASFMSSNIGTAAFMAPEFWNVATSENLEYTRSVDIFATGLVYLSMLQAQQDCTLKPSLEDDAATDEERCQFIGLAMQMRKQNLHEPFKVAFMKLTDKVHIRRIKQLICHMASIEYLNRPDTDQVCQIIHQVSFSRIIIEYTAVCDFTAKAFPLKDSVWNDGIQKSLFV